MTKPAPLSGVRVLDLSRILAGPFATQLLADLGAEVEKVEPIGGDPTRGWGPPFAASGESAYFRCANRGKSAVEIDLKSEAGRAALHGRIARADVLVENFLPRSARELGLTWDALRPQYPRLIVASIRSFASDTHAAERPGYDFLMQAEAGWMALTGESNGRPMKVGAALVDVLAGLYCANAIQAALIHRMATGEALAIEIPLFEAALAGLVNVGSAALLTGEEPRRFGNAHPSIVPYQSFRCRDGEVAIAAGSDRQFESLMRGLDLDRELSAHPGWTTNAGRVRDRDAVVAAIEAATQARAIAEVIALCSAADVAAGPIRGVGDVLAHERGSLHRAVHSLRDPGTGERVEVVGSPILLEGTRACAEVAPPSRVARSSGP